MRKKRNVKKAKIKWCYNNNMCVWLVSFDLDRIREKWPNELEGEDGLNGPKNPLINFCSCVIVKSGPSKIPHHLLR